MPNDQMVNEQFPALEWRFDPLLDALTRSAARVTGSAVALLSVFDTQRQRFLSRHGLAATETARDGSFCAHTLVGDALFEVADASADARFKDHPLVVGELRLRSYAGTALLVGGRAVGTLCVFDREARTLSADQRDALIDLGIAASQCFAAQLGRREQALAQVRLLDFLEAAADWAFECDLCFDVQWLSGGFDADRRPPFGLTSGARLPDAPRLGEDGSLQKLPETLHDALAAALPLRRFIVGDADRGVERWLALSALPMRDDDARIVGYRGFVEDVTDAVRLQAQLRREHVELQAAAAEREFLMRMGDALVPLLQAMAGHAQMLLLDSPDPLAGNARRHLQRVAGAGRRVRDLLDDAQLLLRPEKDGRAVVPRRVDIDLLVAHAISLHASLASGAEVQVQHQPSAQPARILGHEGALLRIVGDLLINGIFSRRGGTLAIATTTTGGRASVAFTDEGAGLDAQQVERLFRSFERHDSATGDDAAPSQGLMPARALAKALGGDIRVRSKAGVGSTFTLELPLADASDGLSARSARQPPVKPWILCIGADSAALRRTRELLAALSGLEVHLARSGADGLQLARSLEPSVVVVDAVLPDMAGGDVVNWLRSHDALNTLPCIALGDSSPAHQRLALDSGFDEVWPQPLHLGDTRDRLQHWLATEGRGPRPSAGG